MPPKLQRMLPALYLFGVLTLLLCPSVLCRDCENFPRIAHGSHQDVSLFFSFTTVVRYECDEGYVLVGKPEMTCKNSQWSWPAPQCKALCTKPEVENGNLSVDKDQYVEPEKVTIQCDSGYGIVGPEIITCSEDGTWHPKVPKCEWEIHNGCEQVLAGRKLMQCLSSPEEVKTALEIHKLFLEIKRLKQESDAREADPENRIHMQTKELNFYATVPVSYWQRATLTAQKSPGLLAVSVCDEAVQHPQGSPSKREEIPNGKLSVEKNQYVSPETVTIHCDPDYRMVGSQSISCSENKSWRLDMPGCKRQVPEGCEVVLEESYSVSQVLGLRSSPGVT